MTPSRLFSPRWLAAGGAVILAAAVGIALMLQNGGSACAAPPSTSAKKGKATFYDLGGGMGNCSFPSAPSDDLFVALGPEQYSAGAACGTYLDVTGPKGKVRVKVIDSCPECSAGHLDLSRTAFKKIANEVQGIVPITYRTVSNPAVPGPISARVKEGSSQYWLAVLIDNHAVQLASVKVNGRAAHRETFNYWVVDSGAGGGPFTIKVADVDGRAVNLSRIKLAPGRTQQTTARLAGAAVQARPPAARAAATKKKRPTSKPVTSAATVVGPSTAPPTESATTAPVAAAEPTQDASVTLAAAGAASACE